MKVNDAAVKQFVRDVIGCNCPEEVFNHIEVRRCESKVKNSPDYEINIGGRLLIVVTSDQAVSAQELPRLMQEGKSTRDARGFNRFRLVVLSDNPSEVEKTLSPQFNQLSAKDEKMHLHVIAKKEFPDLFRKV